MRHPNSPRPEQRPSAASPIGTRITHLRASPAAAISMQPVALKELTPTRRNSSLLPACVTLACDPPPRFHISWVSPINGTRGCDDR